MLFSFMFALIAILCCSIVTASDANPKTIYDFNVVDIEGNHIALSKYRGNVVILVNVASYCGYTDVNYKELQRLQARYANDGLKVVAFPCNQFGQQEPFANAEIHDWVGHNYQVTFDMMEKIDVNGPNASPLYQFLTSSGSATSKLTEHGDIQWNFVKFLIDRDGIPFQRYSYSTSPSAMEPAIRQLLGLKAEL